MKLLGMTAGRGASLAMDPIVCSDHACETKASVAADGGATYIIGVRNDGPGTPWEAELLLVGNPAS